MTSNSFLFSQRQAYWTAQGYKGRAVYDQLATDAELPPQFTQSDITEISGLSSFALKQRRARGMAPAFLRLSSQFVRYPREALCSWLAEMYHSQSAA
jgi:hypothetical protein